MTIRSEGSVLDHYQAMELAVSELLIEKGYFTEEDMVAEIDAMAKRTPEVTLSPEIIERARLPIERMLEISAR